MTDIQVLEDAVQGRGAFVTEELAEGGLGVIGPVGGGAAEVAVADGGELDVVHQGTAADVDGKGHGVGGVDQGGFVFFGAVFDFIDGGRI